VSDVAKRGEGSSHAALNVEVFNPKGEVKGVRQVAARFSEPMVAFGDPRLESPFDIRCEAKGHGHWADGRHWVHDFDNDLPAGLKCNFGTRPKLKAMSGKEVAAASFDFSTGGPAILASSPREGIEYIDEDQVFLLGLDAVADIASVREHAYCSVAGLGEPVSIVWGAGIRAPNGIATSHDRSLEFKVRRDFSLKATCDRINAHAGCIPVLPIRLDFTAPVEAGLAASIQLLRMARWLARRCAQE
jgi:hypothetical protein